MNKIQSLPSGVGCSLGERAEQYEATPISECWLQDDAETRDTQMEALMYGHSAYPHTINKTNIRAFSIDSSITPMGGGLNSLLGVL